MDVIRRIWCWNIILPVSLSTFSALHSFYISSVTLWMAIGMLRTMEWIYIACLLVCTQCEKGSAWFHRRLLELLPWSIRDTKILTNYTSSSWCSGWQAYNFNLLFCIQLDFIGDMPNWSIYTWAMSKMSNWIGFWFNLWSY